jgi:hypothetical protein
MSAVPIVLGPVSVKPEADQSARGPVATPVTPKSSPSEKLAQRVSDAKKNFESTPSPARKNLRLDQQIQALVHGAEETLNTSRYVLVWNKRNQRYGVQALKNRHQEATNEYEALYAAHQNLLSQHTKLLADLTSIMKEFAAVEDLQRKKLDAIRAMTEAESVEHLLQTVCALEIDVAKTTEVPQAIPILSTPVKVHPDTR